MDKVKLVVIDLDGTLLDNQKEIHPFNQEMIQKVQQLGIPVTIATGRGMASTRKYAEQLGITEPLITYNGAVISTSDNSRILQRNLMPLAETKELIRELEDLDCYFKVYYDEYFLVDQESELTQAFSKKFFIPYQIVGLKNLANIIESPLKITVIESPEKLERVWQLLQKWSAHFQVCRDSVSGIEITVRSADKGGALTVLCQEYGIQPCQVMAFGNEGNDINLIRVAGVGIAVANARPELKAVARFFTESNEDQGVGKGLQKYLLRKG